MAGLREWIRRLWGTLRPNRDDSDLEQELRLHLELAAEDTRRRGHAPLSAPLAASIQMGGIAQTMEALRDQRGLPWLHDLSRDIRFGLRLLLRSRVFTLFAVSSLALGIGVTGAAFTLFDAIVLQKLPVPEPERLVVASFGHPGGNFNYSLPYPQFEHIRERNTTLSGVFAMNPFGRLTLSMRGESALADGILVTGDYYSALELAPSVGRLIQPADDRRGDAVAVLSRAYWQRRFGGRGDVVGSAVTLEEQTQDSLSRERLLALLMSYLGGFAVVLACIGLYGLTSYGVTLRTAEIGLRMALGAQSAAVLWMIVREATVTVVAGTIAGLMATLGAVRLVRSQLFGVEPHDPMALAGATALLLAMALIAAYLPARRASRVDPLSALRHE